MLWHYGMDGMQILEAKQAELAKRVTKLRAQLKSAEEELRNLEITVETLTRLGINPDVDSSVPRGRSLFHVTEALPKNEFEALSPKEVHERLIASGISAISQDNVRTILSRNKDRFRTREGRYWRTSHLEIEPSAGHSGDGSKLDEQKEASEW